jgi:hypothetical protein
MDYAPEALMERVMIGLIVSLLIATWALLVNQAPEVLTGLNFLWIWYLIWAVILWSALGVLALMFTLGGAVAGGAIATGLGSLIGLTGSAAISAGFILLFSLKHIFRLAGTYLMLSAVPDSAASFAEADIGRLAIGGVLLLIGVFVFRNTK